MKDSMLKQVAELPGLDSEQLKERWRALYGSEPPAYNKTYLVKRLAYRIQELAFRGLADETKARLVTISCLELQKAKLPFRSMVVHEDFEALPRKDRQRITSAADKQFPTLDDFQKRGAVAFEREFGRP